MDTCFSMLHDLNSWVDVLSCQAKTLSVFYYLSVDSPTDIKHPACVDDFVL